MALIAGAAATVCAGNLALAGNRLLLTGSSTVAPIALEIAKRFEAANPGVRIDVQTGGSARGIRDVRQGMVEIGMVSRDLKPEESDLAAHTFARDGLAMIVHRDNPVAALSRDQIVAIYTGRLADWRDLAAAPGPITVVSKAEGRSTLELFLDHFELKSPDIRAHVIVGDNEQGIKTVAGNARAIGYVSVGAAVYQAGHGVPIRLLPMDGAEATSETVASGRFPILRDLNFVTRGAPTGLAARFLAYAQSPAVADILRRLNVVPVAG